MGRPTIILGDESIIRTMPLRLSVDCLGVHVCRTHVSLLFTPFVYDYTLTFYCAMRTFNENAPIYIHYFDLLLTDINVRLAYADWVFRELLLRVVQEFISRLKLHQHIHRRSTHTHTHTQAHTVAGHSSDDLSQNSDLSTIHNSCWWCCCCCCWCLMMMIVIIIIVVVIIIVIIIINING